MYNSLTETDSCNYLFLLPDRDYWIDQFIKTIVLLKKVMLYFRYDTLVSTHQHLLNREIDNQDRLEKEKANLMKFVEEKNNDIMSFNNQLANLQVKF